MPPKVGMRMVIYCGDLEASSLKTKKINKYYLKVLQLNSHFRKKYSGSSCFHRFLFIFPVKLSLWLLCCFKNLAKKLKLNVSFNKSFLCHFFLFLCLEQHHFFSFVFLLVCANLGSICCWVVTLTFFLFIKLKSNLIFIIYITCLCA